MKQPVGECSYCGQEFMSKQGLKGHEERCAEKHAEEQPKRQVYRPRIMVGNAMVWVPDR